MLSATLTFDQIHDCDIRDNSVLLGSWETETTVLLDQDMPPLLNKMLNEIVTSTYLYEASVSITLFELECCSNIHLMRMKDQKYPNGPMIEKTKPPPTSHSKLAGHQLRANVQVAAKMF